ncbi:PREDICTED: RING-H2 finger protein ATL57 [Tarenaya hassleriana]|uniref:RING-H2 finger protein ATL57 n=1 Tax=Tarenaya hassleriana TaxID=28532 RepID=UPI00053C6F17|nr:PREDICTED: RING-H2 finger protein ATL57 [Tarenaya hassleriana]
MTLPFETNNAKGNESAHKHSTLSRQREPVSTVHNATSSSSPPSTSHNSALDSSMALTIFVLLIALFFMGFFSVYIRHFASDDSTAEISSRPRRRSSGRSPRGPSPSASRHLSSRKGLDSQAVRSLPVYPYTKGAKQKIEDCAICLSDFEDGEAVKVIPYCRHVFHVACVDTWLSSHVSCPFCRSIQLFSDKAVVRGEAESSQGSTVGDGDTCTVVVPGVRRCSSCSSLGQRAGLERSLSI